jgi:hypothetical protein
MASRPVTFLDGGWTAGGAISASTEGVGARSAGPLWDLGDLRFGGRDRRNPHYNNGRSG